MISIRYSFVYITLLLLIICLFLINSTYVSQIDIVWRLQVAERFLNGGTLYSDAIDPNGPMITLLYCIPVLLSTIANIPQLLALEIYLSVLTFLIVLIICSQITGTKTRTFLLALIISFIFILLTGLNSGQKEHLFFLFASPFMYQIINPFNVDFSKRTQLFFGILAGIGVSIKPFFMLLPIALSLTLLATKEFKKNSVALHSIFAFNFIFYLALFPILPEYISLLTIATTAYSSYFQAPILWGGFSSIPPIMLIFYLVLSNTKKSILLKIIASLIPLLMISMIQQKWFIYHFYPPVIFSSIVTICLVYISLKKYKQISLPLIILLICNLGFISYFWIFGRFAFHQQYFSNTTMLNLTAVIKDIPSDEKSIILSTNMEHSNYPYFYLGKQNSSSFSNLWTLPTIFIQGNDTAKGKNIDAVLTYTYDVLFKDLSINNISHILIQKDWPERSQENGSAILQLLQKDSRINAILKDFEAVDSILQDYIYLKHKSLLAVFFD